MTDREKRLAKALQDILAECDQCLPAAANAWVHNSWLVGIKTIAEAAMMTASADA